MRYENEKSGNGGIIHLYNESEEIGRLTYTIMPAEQKMIISYVMVYPKFEGKGMGKFLVTNAIEFAREQGLKVFPHCSYARSVMRRMSGVEDVFLA